jgi:hypothetical protein
MATVKEVRVWCEKGDLIGYATVASASNLLAATHPPGFFRVEFHAPRDSGYAWPDLGFGARPEAEDYARQWAESLMDWARRAWPCPCKGSEPCPCDGSACGVIGRPNSGHTSFRTEV